MVWIMKHKRSVGLKGEDLAAEYLAGKGYAILERNVRTHYGEIDLVMMDGDTLVFVEVKTRTSRKYGYPEDAITNQKKIHLLDSAQEYLQVHPEFYRDWRIDVLAIEITADQSSPRITHFENAVTDMG
jgi:putative endonuclease